MTYANYMFNKLDGGKDNDVPIGELDFFSKDNLKKIYDQVYQAVSLTYFQSSLKLIQKEGKYIQEYRWGLLMRILKIMLILCRMEAGCIHQSIEAIRLLM